MVLLKLTDNSKIDFYEYRDREYFNKYTYKATFTLNGIMYTRYHKTPKRLESLVNSMNLENSKTKNQKHLLDNFDCIKNFIIFQEKHKKDKTAFFRMENNSVSIFTNDLNIFTELKQNFKPKLTLTEVKTSQYRGTKYFSKKPKHNYRIHLKSKKVDINLIRDLNNIFYTNKFLYPSKSLRDWILYAMNSTSTYRGRYCSSHFFIDYDDENIISYLALLHGELLGKSFKLEERPNTK